MVNDDLEYQGTSKSSFSISTWYLIVSNGSTIHIYWVKKAS